MRDLTKGYIPIGLAVAAGLWICVKSWQISSQVSSWTVRMEMRVGRIEDKMGIAKPAEMNGEKGLFIPTAEADEKKSPSR